MAKQSHYGFIKDTKPRPKVVWGTMAEVAKEIGGNKRNLYLVINGQRESYLGFRQIKDEEEIVKYYKPPKPPEKPFTVRTGDYSKISKWRITLVKDFDQDEGFPQDPHRKFTGNVREIVTTLGLDHGNLLRMIRTYAGMIEDGSNTQKSSKGWSIYKIIKAPKKQPQVKIIMTREDRKVRQEYRQMKIAEYERQVIS